MLFYELMIYRNNYFSFFFTKNRIIFTDPILDLVEIAMNEVHVVYFNLTDSFYFYYE